MSDKIKELELQIEELKRRNKILDDENDDYQEEINDLEDKIYALQTGFHLEGVHANNRTQMAMEELFDNLDYIPIAELENFINTHKQL
jgi:predicted RNase H-like nuclease (RuvC/YqgF family)